MQIDGCNFQVKNILQGNTIESISLGKNWILLLLLTLISQRNAFKHRKKVQRILEYIEQQLSSKNMEIVVNLNNLSVCVYLEHVAHFYYRTNIRKLKKIQAITSMLLLIFRSRIYEGQLRDLNLFALETQRLLGYLIKIHRGFENVDFNFKSQVSKESKLKLLF